MNKNIFFYSFIIIILILNPIIIIYSDAHNKSVTNNITFDVDVAESISKYLDEFISLGVTISESLYDSYTQYIILNVFVADNATFISNITITSSPDIGSGFVIVDGNSSIVTPELFVWDIASKHNITAYSTIDIVADESRYLFSNWSDSGDLSHYITVPTINSTYTVYYDIQYKLDVTDGSGTNWYNDNYNASSSAYYVKDLISGESRSNLIGYTLNGSTTNIVRSNTGNYTIYITMDDYHELIWNYGTQYYCNSTSSVSDLDVTQIGSQTSDDWYDDNTDAELQVVTPQTDDGITYQFTNWVWYLSDVLQSNSTDNPFNITMTNYVDVTAYWKTMGVDVNIDGNATITVDGVPVVTPDTFHFEDNTIHNITATYVSGFVNAMLNVLGNATITYDGTPVITPDIFYLASGSNHTIISISSGGVGSSGGIGVGLVLGIFFILLLGTTLFMALSRRR